MVNGLLEGDVTVGNLIVQPSGSGIAVDGALESLSVEGYFLGQGGTSSPSAIARTARATSSGSPSRACGSNPAAN